MRLDKKVGRCCVHNIYKKGDFPRKVALRLQLRPPWLFIIDIHNFGYSFNVSVLRDCLVPAQGAARLVFGNACLEEILFLL